MAILLHQVASKTTSPQEWHDRSITPCPPISYFVRSWPKGALRRRYQSERAEVSNRISIRKFIRFALGQMTPQNEHHRFEDLCFEIAKSRIATNIVRATGPVQAGGDQGRDFEGYKSFLSHSPDLSNAFLSKIEDRTLVFCCSLNKEIKGKIEGDLVSIFSQLSKPDIVYYFCSVDLDVSKRHALQATCQKDYGASLEILDGQTISDILSDADCFWIAEEFLNVPSDIFPPIAGDEEYQSLRTRWLLDDTVIANYADFTDVKRGLRRSWKETNLVGDVKRWTDLMASIVPHPQFGRRARYELAVCALKSKGDLIGQAENIGSYFETFPAEPGIDDLEDGYSLSAYALTASRVGKIDAPQGVADGWSDLVMAAVNVALGTASTVVERCRLTILKGQALSHNALVGRNSTGHVEALALWNAATEMAKTDPLAEVSLLARLMEVCAPIMGELPLYDRVAERTDALLAAREGAAAAADSARKRGVAFFKTGQTLRAIDQIQKAKVGWFSAENIQGSIIASLLLASWFEELKLPHAARYYATGAIEVCGRTGGVDAGRNLVQAGFLVAESFYLAGDALTYLGVVGKLLPYHWEHMSSPGDLNVHTHLKKAFVYAGAILSVLSSYDEALKTAVLDIIRGWDIEPSNLQEIERAPNAGVWQRRSSQEIEQVLAVELGANMVSDLRPYAHACWNALGIVWTITGPKALQLRADEIAAVMQILQTELASLDLLIVPSNVEIRLKASVAKKWKATQVGKNNRLIWEIDLGETLSGRSDAADPATNAQDILGLIISVLGKATALEEDEFLETIEGKLSQELFGRLVWIRPPAELLAKARSLADLTLPTLSIAVPEIAPLAAPALQWNARLSAKYSKEASLTAITNRYENMQAFARTVAPAIMANARTKALMVDLRKMGLRDWYILLILHNMALNRRLNEAGIENAADPEAVVRATNKVSFADSKAGKLTLEPDTIHQDEIDMVRLACIYNVAETWGLANHRMTPDFQAIQRLLTDRFNFLIDDVAHEDVFGWEE